MKKPILKVKEKTALIEVDKKGADIIRRAIVALINERVSCTCDERNNGLNNLVNEIHDLYIFAYDIGKVGTYTIKIPGKDKIEEMILQEVEKTN